MIRYRRRRPSDWRRPCKGGPVGSGKHSTTEPATFFRRPKRVSGGNDVVKRSHRFGTDYAPRVGRHHEPVSFCELIRANRCGSKRELRLTARTCVDVVAAFQQVAENGQELRLPDLVQSNPEAAKVGIEPSGDQQTRVPKDDAVSEAFADNKIERSAPTTGSNVEL